MATLSILVNNAGITRDHADHDDVRSGLGRGHQHQPEKHVQLLESRRQAHDAQTRRDASSTWPRWRGKWATPGRSNYSASKGGQIAFTKALAREVACAQYHGQRHCAGLCGYRNPWTPCRLKHWKPRSNWSHWRAKANPKKWPTPPPSSPRTKPRIITGQVLGVDGGMAMM
ncbi:MAG: hypothetical protein MZV63_06805 [Marinilabiliales bacterium]|nr:hypothetical protein [Marinilabiliales bacterium]